MCWSVAALWYKFLKAKTLLIILDLKEPTHLLQNKVQRLVLLWTSLCVFISEDPYQDITSKIQNTQTNKQNKIW